MGIFGTQLQVPTAAIVPPTIVSRCDPCRNPRGTEENGHRTCIEFTVSFASFEEESHQGIFRLTRHRSNRVAEALREVPEDALEPCLGRCGAGRNLLSESGQPRIQGGGKRQEALPVSSPPRHPSGLLNLR